MSFVFCKVHHHLEVVDRASMTFRSEHKYLIEAAAPSRFLHHGYFWTGSGSEREIPPELISEIDDWGFPKHRAHGPLIVEGDSRILVVDLGRKLDVGEQTTVHLLHKMKDLKGTFKPILRIRPSSLVRDEITLKVTLPNWSGLKMNFTSFTHDTENEVVPRTLTPLELEGGKVVFEEVIVNPDSGNFGHKLEWTHNET